MIDIGDFGVVNEVYGKYFSGECPARCAMQAAALPKGALVEIEAIAVKERPELKVQQEDENEWFIRCIVFRKRGGR